MDPLVRCSTEVAIEESAASAELSMTSERERLLDSKGGILMKEVMVSMCLRGKVASLALRPPSLP